MLLLIDNYDSFTYNLVHYLGELGVATQIYRNDEISVAQAMALEPAGIVLSPGPCTPNEAGICLDLTRAAAEARVPLLGVCLGHQTLGQAFGGQVVQARDIVHGKIAQVRHDGAGVFEGLPSPFAATRYHSLVVDRDSLPDCLGITATLEDGTIMGLQHRDLPLHGVQFHPESIRSEHGHALLSNFVEMLKDSSMSEALKPLLDAAARGPLTRDQARAAFEILFDGEATPSQIGGLLMALRTRGETVDEYAAAAQAMRAKCNKVNAPDDAMDIVGTGGDGKGTLNISTATAFVVAGAGTIVAKHGNRNLSSKSGAADALGRMGIKVMVGAGIVEKSLREAGIGFMMAPMHHPAIAHVMPTRAELGTRTIFNILGPLTNPAGVKRQLTGAFSRELIRPMAETLRALGSEKAWLVHGSDGTDELTIAGLSWISALDPDGTISDRELHPEDAGLPVHPFDDIRGGTPDDNAAAFNALLDGTPSAYRDAVLLNAAAALMVADAAPDLKTGVEMARHSIDSGAARAKIMAVARISQGT